MKKIFTLLLSVGLTTMAFAQFPGNQRGYEKENGVAYNDNSRRGDENRFNDHSGFRKNEMDRKIYGINQDYDLRIQNVKNNWFMNRYRKQRLISQLEEQRREEIKCVFDKFYDGHNEHEGNGPGKRW